MKLNELEIKIQIGSKERFEEVFALCKKHFGENRSSILQLDEYYDTPCGQLKSQDLVLRIRTVNSKKTIAMKSPRQNLPSGMTNRIELEFLAADGEEVEQQLKQQGLVVDQSTEKERWTFVYKENEIVLDRLPFIGYFIEIEGPSEEAILEVVELLNLGTSPVIRNHYGELMAAKLLALQLPPTFKQVTFAAEEKFQYENAL